MSVESRRLKVKKLLLAEEIEKHQAMLKIWFLAGFSLGVVIGQLFWVMLGF